MSQNRQEKHHADKYTNVIKSYAVNDVYHLYTHTPSELENKIINIEFITFLIFLLLKSVHFYSCAIELLIVPSHNTTDESQL